MSKLSVPLFNEGDTVISQRTGQIGKVVSIFDRGEFYLIKSSDSEEVFYATGRELASVVEKEGGDPDIDPAALARFRDQRSAPPATKIDPEKARYNLNTITAEQLHKVLKGITIESAKHIVLMREAQASGNFRDWASVEKALGADFDVNMIKGTGMFFLKEARQAG